MSQRRSGSRNADETEARLQELCAAEGWSPDGSDGEEDEEEEMENSEPLDDSDVILSDSGRQAVCCQPSNRKLASCPPDILNQTVQIIPTVILCLPFMNLSRRRFGGL